MNIGLLNILRIGATASWDFRFDMAQAYAGALRNAIELHMADGTKKQESFFLSLKGTQTARGNFQDRLYVGDVRYVENHLRWNDEELADDDQIVNVVVIEGPVTRDGGACSYGTKDFRNQVIYANSIPQVVAHIFVTNTPGGESACRKDYDEMFASCRANGKKTVQYVDGMCGSSGVNLGCRCDYVIVRNPKDDYGCIGSMAAFWATPDGAVDSRDGSRFIEIVGDDSPEKNDWYREAAQGDYEKLKAMINRDTEEFQQTVRENRPNVKEEHLTGRVFEAQEVLGSLVDEIGDFNRAIECALELADGSLAGVRDAEVITPNDEPDGEQPEGEEPEDEIDFNPINDTTMTDEEKKAAEVAEQPAATQEQTPATEQPAEGAAATEAPAVSEENAQEQAGAQAAAAEENAGEQGAAPTGEAAGTEAPASQEAIENATAEIDKIQETLESAQALVAQRDQEIAQLKETLATLNGIAEERDQANSQLSTLNSQLDEQGKALTAAEAKIAEHVATIEKLNKQVKELQSEVKELSEKPAPMVDAGAGIPQDNGTGEAPKKQERITSDMSYEEIQEFEKRKREKK